MQSPANVTLLLSQIAAGEKPAIDQLYSLIYEELKRTATDHLIHWPAGQTLQATALVNEAYIKLVGRKATNYASRLHFFHTAAQVMRRILVDRQRAKITQKRGGGAARVEMNDISLAELIAGKSYTAINWDLLDMALQKLKHEWPRRHQVVELRFFAGRSMSEIAELLELSLKTIDREWKEARTFLKMELDSARSAPE